MKFFFDTSISHRIPAAINALKEDIETEKSKTVILHLREKFKANVDDYDWLNTLVLEGGWVVVSADTRITRNELQKKSGVRKISSSSYWKRVGGDRNCGIERGASFEYGQIFYKPRRKLS